MQSIKQQIKKQGDKANQLTREAKSKAQLAYEARGERNKMIKKFFGWIE